MSDLRIEAARLDLPAVPARFLPERFLEGAMRRGFLDPGTHLKERPPRAPRARVHAAPHEFLSVLERMDSRDGIEFELAHAIPVGSTGEYLGAGAFRLAKGGDPPRDRLIMNRTPANSQERSFGFCRHLFPLSTHDCAPFALGLPQSRSSRF